MLKTSKSRQQIYLKIAEKENGQMAGGVGKRTKCLLIGNSFYTGTKTPFCLNCSFFRNIQLENKFFFIPVPLVPIPVSFERQYI